MFTATNETVTNETVNHTSSRPGQHVEIKFFDVLGTLCGTIQGWDGHNWLPTEAYHITRNVGKPFLNKGFCEKVAAKLNAKFQAEGVKPSAQDVADAFRSGDAWDVQDDPMNYYEPDPLDGIG